MEGFQVIGYDWKYLYVNDAVAKHAHLTRGDLLGRTMMEVFPGIEKTPMFSLLKECMEQRVHKRMENEFTYPDGSVGWFDLSFEPVTEGVAILSIEITDRKRTEENMRRLAKVLLAIRNVNQLITMERNKDLLLQRVCDDLIETRGYDQAWIVLVDTNGRPTASAESGQKSGHKPLYSSVRKGKAIDCVNFALARPSVFMVDTGPGKCMECFREDDKVPCKVMLSRLENQGTVYGVLGVHIPQTMTIGDEERSLFKEVAGDISHAIYVISIEAERERIDEELRASEERLKMIFDSVNDGIFYQSMDGQFKEVNKASCEMLGYTREEMLGMTGKDIEVPDEVSSLPEMIETIQRTGPHVLETNYMKKDGKPLPIEISARIVTIKGEPVVLSVARDISGRKKMERLLKQREKYEIFGFLASALPVFASSIPVEVRNRLVSSFGDLFEKNIRPRFEEYVHTTTEKTTECAKSDAINRKTKKYLAWISNLFSNFGIDVESFSEGASYGFDLRSCPWAEQSRGNPIFCLICRTMAIRSFGWTDLSGDMNQLTAIANGGSVCKFQISLNREDNRVG